MGLVLAGGSHVAAMSWDKREDNLRQQIVGERQTRVWRSTGSKHEVFRVLMEKGKRFNAR